MAPDARERREVGGPESRPIGVAPEPDRHRWHWRGDDELALLADDRPAVFSEDLDARPEHAARDLAGPHRHERARAEETGAQVRPAAQRPEPDRRRAALD